MCFGLSDYFFKEIKVCVIVLFSFWLKSLPGNIEPNGVNTPTFQFYEIFFDERTIGIVLCANGVIWKLFIDNIHAMHDSKPVVFIL